MRPKSNKEQAKKFGNELENGIVIVDILINLLKLFCFPYYLLAGSIDEMLRICDGNFLHF
jgi:hypothetical protein